MLLEFGLKSIFKMTFFIAFYGSFSSTEATIMVVIVEGGKEVARQRKKKRPVPELIDPVFAKTSPKTSFSITENERNVQHPDPQKPSESGPDFLTQCRIGTYSVVLSLKIQISACAIADGYNNFCPAFR